MYKIDASGHVSNEFSDGNPLTGQEATILDAAFANEQMYEIINVILHAGIALNKGTRTQLRDAIIAIAAGGGVAVTAQGVSIDDGGGYFSPGPYNVEAALQFLAEFAANGSFASSRFRRQVIQLTGAANNAVAGHLENLLEADHGSATTYTIPVDGTLTAPVGSTITLFQKGAGKVEVVAAAGVTLYKPVAFNAKSMQQHAAIVLAKVAADTWRLGGTLEAAA